ncbi:MAG: AMP-dependent synthetase [Chloroflexi bacterium]|nr:MAG: AMP-dependent synthetase [Chloroflexota bacterium]TMD64215.1 MAG: AMP-dependent synthetase [Chloroflexota bacterium]
MSAVAPVWSPSDAQARDSRLSRFMQQHGCASYPELCRKAAAEPRWFWDALVKALGIVWSTPYEAVMDTSAGVPFTRWFPGGRLNAYESAVQRHQRTDPDRLAIIAENEGGATRRLTYAELEDAVERTAAGLRAIGVERGVAVGLYLPLVLENAVALLAITKLGAIAVPLFSGFGAEAVRQRISDAQARVLITADGATRRGRAVPMKPIAEQAIAGLPHVQRLVVVRCAGLDTPLVPGRDLSWEEIVDDSHPRVATEAMRSDEPLMLLYTSGTTGRPKGTVHGHAGLPIKSAQDWAFGMDVRPGERVMWVTDMGWVMGPLLVFGSLMLGGTAVLYDGAPDYPDPARVWAVAERQGVTHLGISPTLTRVLMSAGDRALPPRPLSQLRVLASTGEPWTPEAWAWLFEVVGGRNVPIMNYSGGTECGGGIVSGNFLTAATPGSFAGPIPGVDAEVFDDAGQPVRGEVGELVIRQPYLGMTLGFWKDPQRYLETYWSRWPNVWVHGDWAMIDEDGLWYILGRSDDTIKVAGKRVGPAEVEAAALDGTDVAEAAAVGIPDPLKGQSVVIFAVARPNADPAPIPAAVSGSVERSLGKPFKPAAVHVIPRLPKTRNGKILRRVIRNVFLGDPPGDLSSIDDMASLDPIRTLGAASPPEDR